MDVDVDKDLVDAKPVSASSDKRSPEALANGHGVAAPAVEAERNTIFDNLVKVEGEVSGLIAYSIYKQNKRAWLSDFQKIVGRQPDEVETRAYIIGESTDRRLSTYRHLAQSILAGQGPEGMARSGAANRSSSFYIVWAVVLVAAVAVLAYALRSGVALPK
jgi:hypothetical protein